MRKVHGSKSVPHGCQQGLDADDVQHTREIAVEYVQRHFGRDIGNRFIGKCVAPIRIFSVAIRQLDRPLSFTPFRSS